LSTAALSLTVRPGRRTQPARRTVSSTSSSSREERALPIISGGTLSGGGIINGPVTVNGASNPAVVALEVDGAAGSSNDVLFVKTGDGDSALEVFQTNGDAAGTYVYSHRNDNPALYVDAQAVAPATDLVTVADAAHGSVAGVSAAGVLYTNRGLKTNAITSGALPTVALVSGTGTQLSTARDCHLHRRSLA